LLNGQNERGIQFLQDILQDEDNAYVRPAAVLANELIAHGRDEDAAELLAAHWTAAAGKEART
jgi:hypothetical protein